MFVPLPPGWKRRKEQLLRNSGHAYINRSGEVQLGKKMRAGCTPSCRMKCLEQCPDDQRLTLFQEYYSLANIESQWRYLAKCIDKTVPKGPIRKDRIKDLERRRSNNIRYCLHILGKKVRVCQSMFLATFDIRPNLIRTVVQKTNDEGALIMGDRRRGPRNKSESSISETNT